MPYNSSTPIPGNSALPYTQPDNSGSTIKLKCSNLHIAFLMFNLIFWIFIASFICMVTAHTAIPALATPARAITTFFGNTNSFMILPLSILGTMLYFIYGRKTLTWYNGVFIDDDPITVQYFQFKYLSPNITFIYLQDNSGRLWILSPTTSQDNSKFKNIPILKREQAINQTQTKLLYTNLLAAGATEKKFRFIPTGVIVSFLVCITVIALALLLG
jgi:hypothetical protein